MAGSTGGSGCAGSGHRAGLLPHRAGLQKRNSRVWLEAVAQVPDVLLPEFVQREEEAVPVARREKGTKWGRSWGLQRPMCRARLHAQDDPGSLGTGRPVSSQALPPLKPVPSLWSLPEAVFLLTRGGRHAFLCPSFSLLAGRSCDSWSSGSHLTLRGISKDAGAARPHPGPHCLWNRLPHQPGTVLSWTSPRGDKRPSCLSHCSPAGPRCRQPTWVGPVRRGTLAVVQAPWEGRGQPGRRLSEWWGGGLTRTRRP